MGTNGRAVHGAEAISAVGRTRGRGGQLHGGFLAHLRHRKVGRELLCMASEGCDGGKERQLNVCGLYCIYNVGVCVCALITPDSTSQTLTALLQTTTPYPISTVGYPC